jgi:RNA-splicing ligase RtcB
MAKKVPVTSVTPKSKVKETDKESKKRTSKLIGAIAVNLIPGAKVASTTAKFVSRTAAKKMVPTETKTVVRKFTQGKKANIVEEAPKKYKQGPKSPVKGTKVTVVKETKGQTPLQYATVTKGAVTRRTTGKRVTIAKTATNTAYAMDKAQEAKKSKKKK